MEVVEGMQFDRGFLSPYFVTDSQKMEAVLENPLVLLYDRKISTLKDLLPVPESTANMHRPLVIVAEDVEQDALATLVVNRIRGALSVRGGQGPRIRRSAKGHHAGHRHPYRRVSSLRRNWDSTCKKSRWRIPRKCQARRGRQRQHDNHWRRRR